MEKKTKASKQPSTQVTPHPEGQQRVKPGVPDDASSKAGPNKQSDDRSAHDKDGNEGNAQPRRR